MGGGVEECLHAFLTLTLDGGEWSAAHHSHFTPRERGPCYPLDRRLGGLQSRSGRGGEEKRTSATSVMEPQWPSHCTD
jgi:hypothetical protein